MYLVRVVFHHFYQASRGKYTWFLFTLRTVVIKYFSLAWFAHICINRMNTNKSKHDIHCWFIGSSKMWHCWWYYWHRNIKESAWIYFAVATPHCRPFVRFKTCYMLIIKAKIVIIMIMMMIIMIIIKWWQWWW